MGCFQVKVSPLNPANDNGRENVRATVANSNITRNTSGQLTAPIVNRLSMLVSTPNTLANTNHPEQSTQPLETAATTSLDSKGGDNTVTVDHASRFTGLSPAPENPTETVVYRQNILRGPASNVDMSDVPKDNSMTIKSNTFTDSYSLCRSFNSSAVTSQIHTHGQYVIQRFISARPIRPTNRESTHHDNWSEQDDSYSLRNSFTSAASADSEASVIDLPRSMKARRTRPKNLQLKQKSFSDKTSIESDGLELQHITPTPSRTIDVQVMTERLVSDLRSASAKLSNRDFQSRGPISETTSDADEK